MKTNSGQAELVIKEVRASLRISSPGCVCDRDITDHIFCSLLAPYVYWSPKFQVYKRYHELFRGLVKQLMKLQCFDYKVWIILKTTAILLHFWTQYTPDTVFPQETWCRVSLGLYKPLWSQPKSLDFEHSPRPVQSRSDSSERNKTQQHEQACTHWWDQQDKDIQWNMLWDYLIY